MGQEHKIVPDFVAIITDAANIALLPLEAIPILRGELAQLDTQLLGRLLQLHNASDETDAKDHLLNAEQAAAILGTSKDYLYRHSGSLPFTVRIGRKVLFSASGIHRYIRQRMGR